jgi:hypothetical protein
MKSLLSAATAGLALAAAPTWDTLTPEYTYEVRERGTHNGGGVGMVRGAGLTARVVSARAIRLQQARGCVPYAIMRADELTSQVCPHAPTLPLVRARDCRRG